VLQKLKTTPFAISEETMRSITREIKASRTLIERYERMLVGCKEQSFSGYENGNGVNVGDAIDKARNTYSKL
jgi:hypothetical protein